LQNNFETAARPPSGKRKEWTRHQPIPTYNNLEIFRDFQFEEKDQDGEVKDSQSYFYFIPNKILVGCISIYHPKHSFLRYTQQDRTIILDFMSVFSQSKPKKTNMKFIGK
jgi:hypothetical protein